MGQAVLACKSTRDLTLEQSTGRQAKADLRAPPGSGFCPSEEQEQEALAAALPSTARAIKPHQLWRNKQEEAEIPRARPGSSVGAAGPSHGGQEGTAQFGQKRPNAGTDTGPMASSCYI